ncbi:MAG: S-layer homology domain-containing protein [bacterium]
MGDGALSSDRISIITNSNGTYSFEISLGTVSIATLTGGIGSVKSTDGKLSNIKYDMATDSKGNSILDSSGSEYIEKLYFEATEISEFYNIEIYIPVMENSGNQDARLKFDWDNATLIPNGDQEEAEKEEETFYFTFGGENDDAVLIPDGDHEIKVGITTNDNTELGKVVEQVLAEAGTLTVDRTGDGKLTLRFTEKVIINGREYRVKGFRYKNIPTPSAINIFNVFPILSSNATPEIDDITGEVIFDIFDPTAISLDVILDVEYTDDEGNIVEDEVDVELNLGYDNVDGAEDYDDDLVTDREDDENDNTSTPDTTTPDSNTGGDNSDGGNSGNTNTSVDIKNNGNYTVTTYLYHETKDETSMGDGALSKNRTSKVTNSNGTYSFEVNMSTLTFTGLTGGIGSIKSTDGKLSNITYDIGTDSNGEQYVKKLYFKTKEISDFYDIEIYIPVMGDYGTQQARLYFDWDTLKTSSSGASTGSTSSSSSNSSTTETSTEEEILLEEVDMTINGNYLVPLTLMHESKDQVSMGNGAFEENKYAIVNTQNGTYTVVVQPSTITMSSLTSGIGTLISTDGAMNSLSILERQKLETGDEYISKFQFTTTKFDTEYPIQITVPNSPMGITDARLVLDWENAIKANELASGSSISNAQLLSLLEVSTNTNLPLEVQDESGLTISFDAEALQSILDLAGEEDVVINVKELEDTSTLTQAQQDILSTDAKLYHFEILIGEEAITSLDSGKVTIGLPYTLYAGQEEEALSVSYVDEAGEVKEFDFNYDYKNITVETSLLGLYAVEYDETYTTPEEEQDDSNELDLDSVVLEFNDVSSADWFYDYVKYTYARGIFKGTSDTTFDPYSNATREAFVTVLYRLAGEPNPNTRNEFTDVLSDQYYTNAVVWASENSIVSGYGNNKFGTGDSITREQMVTIMYNFANHMGVDMSSSEDLTSFTDASQISSYAVDAFKWAVAEKIISGNGNDTLTPKNTATRSEISKILTVLAQNYDL